MDGADDRTLRLVLGPGVVGRGFDRRVITIEPGGRRHYEPQDWCDALVVVTCGTLELEGSSGGRSTIQRGDVLWLADLPLRALHNRGVEPAVLVAVARRPDRNPWRPGTCVTDAAIDTRRR